MKIAIVYPIYITTKKHYELAIKAITSFVSRNDLMFIGVINQLDDRYISFLFMNGMEVIHNDENCVSSAWNIGIKYAIDTGADKIFIPNLDIECDVNCIDNLSEYLDKHSDVLMASGWCNLNNGQHRDFLVNRKTMTDAFSCFMVRNTFVGKLAISDKDKKNRGKFDESFKPAYCEDIDMQHRIELSGHKHMCVGSAKFDHFRSSTIRNHENVAWASENLGNKKAEEIFKKKWGNYSRAEILSQYPSEII